MYIAKPLKPAVIFIVGPTAVGKTRLSLAFASRIKGEIISCDSMQVYRGMAILSQAPSASDRKKVRHHLIGILDPRKSYSAASFRLLATKQIEAIVRRGRTPVIVGGSGLYVKALVDGLFPSPPANSNFRESMQGFISRYGAERLHEKLSKIDPVAALKIHPNDCRRIIRALEIHKLTGKTMTELTRQTCGLKDSYNIKIFGLTAPRKKIYENIDNRVDSMLKKGLLNEVVRLRKKALSKTAAVVLGLNEISGYLDKEYDLETAISLMKRNTRHFAKRQLTWFRADKRIRWFDVSEMAKSAIVKEMMKGIS